MSILPNSDMIWSKVLRMSAAFDTSQLMAATLRPEAAAWILALASASVPWSRARIATSAPDLAYSAAIARPSPLLPPVTTALRPFSLMSIPGLLPKIATVINLSSDRSPVCPHLSMPSGPRPRDGVIRFGSGLVAPAVTLAACAHRADLLPGMNAASLDDRRPGPVPAFLSLGTLLDGRIQGRNRFNTAKLTGCTADKRCWSDTCDPVFRYGKRGDLSRLQAKCLQPVSRFVRREQE